eukprot:EG_transcript_24605
MNRMLQFLFCFLLVSVSSSSDVKGAVNLDSVSFSKLVGRHYDALVKFDKQYPYGDKEDEWKNFAARIGEMNFPDLLLAQVGVQDYGEKVNDDLREKFGVKSDDYPVFMLFKKGSAEPILYKGEVKADAMSGFLVSELGIYISLPGCIEVFDKLAKGFISSTAADRRQRIADAEQALAALADESEKENAKFYINVMHKIIEKGEDYPAAEKNRLEKLVQSKITDEKKKVMRHKLNILPSFK